MRRVILGGIGLAGTVALALACTKNDSTTGSSTNSSVGGKLSSVSVSSVVSKGGVQTMSTKTITHVMAVSPSAGNAERYLATVASDGTFNLALNAGKPYMIVFIAQNGTLTGPDMIVGTVKVAANGLDTLPIAQAGAVELGDVSVTNSSSTANATVSTSVSDLLSDLGVSSSEATYIGNVDDLALRLANPDVDVNGVIDATEGKSFGMDWHIRANTKLSGTDLKITDIENAFANEANVTLDWTLGSGYAVYPTSFDNVDYASGGSNTLQNSGAFAASGTAITQTSYSGGTFSSSRQWGPDYAMNTQELGASDAAATFTYTLGTSGKVLKFSNVRTKTKAQLNAEGVMLPFIKINTSSSKITGIGYKWMKRTGSGWSEASAAEVSLLVQDSGAYLTLYTQKGSGVEYGLSFTIPATSATGTINIGDSGFRSTGVSNTANVALTDVCSAALSYDDKMGLRIFAGAPTKADGVTACN